MKKELTAVVEIPEGSYYKYEIEKETGDLVIDRVLSQPTPSLYGEIPGTISEDMDPLDCFILSNYPIVPCARVQVIVEAVFICDDNGESDPKLVCTVKGEEMSGLDFLRRKDEVQKYLETYKIGFSVLSFAGHDKAVELYNEALKLYNETDDEQSFLEEAILNDQVVTPYGE